MVVVQLRRQMESALAVALLNQDMDQHRPNWTPAPGNKRGVAGPAAVPAGGRLHQPEGSSPPFHRQVLEGSPEVHISQIMYQSKNYKRSSIQVVKCD